MTETLSKNTSGNEFIEKEILQKTPDEKIKIMSSPVEFLYEGGLLSTIFLIVLIVQKIKFGMMLSLD